MLHDWHLKHAVCQERSFIDISSALNTFKLRNSTAHHTSQVWNKVGDKVRESGISYRYAVNFGFSCDRSGVELALKVKL